jgi:hypothetical protein
VARLVILHREVVAHVNDPSILDRHTSASATVRPLASKTWPPLNTVRISVLHEFRPTPPRRAASAPGQRGRFAEAGRRPCHGRPPRWPNPGAPLSVAPIPAGLWAGGRHPSPIRRRCRSEAKCGLWRRPGSMLGSRRRWIATAGRRRGGSRALFLRRLPSADLGSPWG